MSGWGVAADEEGGAVITGHTESALTGPSPRGTGQVFLARYDGTGRQVWTRQFDDGYGGAAQGVARDPAGNFVIAGYTYYNGPVGAVAQAVVAKYGGAGERLWTRRLRFGGDWTEAAAVATDAFGNVVTVGTTGSGEPNDIFVAKYDSGGRHLGTFRRKTEPYEFGYAVAVESEGNIVVGGSVEGDTRNSVAAVLKLDGAGHLVWQRRLDPIRTGSVKAVAIDLDDGILVTGTNGLSFVAKLAP